MARYLVAGVTQQELCRLFGMTPGRVSIIANSPIMRAEVKRLTSGLEDGARDIQKEIKELSADAFDIVAEDLLTMEKTPAKTRLALEVLDRSGFSRGSRPGEQLSITPIQIVINTPGPGDNNRGEGGGTPLRENSPPPRDSPSSPRESSSLPRESSEEKIKDL